MRNALPAWTLVGPAAVKALSEPVPTWRELAQRTSSMSRPRVCRSYWALSSLGWMSC